MMLTMAIIKGATSPRPNRTITIDGQEFATISVGANHIQVPRTRLSVALHAGNPFCEGQEEGTYHKVAFTNESE